MLGSAGDVAGVVAVGVALADAAVEVADDDLNPYAPDGWWAAVDQLQGRCVVIITRSGDIDLSQHQAGEQLAALVDTGRAVFAALPVDTIL